MNSNIDKEILSKITDEDLTDIKNNYGSIPGKDK